ncbi:non-hydrolyzing UDP-N-acetylglucosamine 2-epimerase [Amycolatopsis aidingensis]|uniref:non-hydrolyzing UDP-N-acetylglucosamine 2-epimerase n=1 Tax=Amycolatopsis aidingensis TaxID=2842453 RepID=UPI001C0D8AC8|nr:UDP-N-acetylglucosamine 2-epimerase (non-hydrolyzing) [Amycolatopsis aidingensis]
MRIMLLAGTRPEAVKLAPLALALDAHPDLDRVLVHSGQHDGLVEQALVPFGLAVDALLGSPRRHTGSQAELVAGLLPALDEVLRAQRPDALVVQGDTTTVLAGALAAFWLRVPVVHLEAGLRTRDLSAPFPEEGTRQMVARIAALHLVPTDRAAAALRAEQVPADRIVHTGNTVVDAVLAIAARDLPAENHALAAVEAELASTGGRLVLVTSHRRESWGEPMARTFAAVRALVADHPDIRVLLPAHPNPAVRAQAEAELGDLPEVRITEPLGYPDLVRALRLSAVVLTDSGGIQEEAPSFGTPVLVLREVTERMEAVQAGCAWLVGTDPELIAKTAGAALSGTLRATAAPNPYGDGAAAARAVAAIEGLAERD